MKDVTRPARLGIFASLFDSLTQQGKPSVKSMPGRDASRDKRERPNRREFSYYQKVVDDETLQMVGHLADISSGGFKLDSQKPLPINKDFRFRLNLSSEVADKPYMVFVARSRWCKVDPLDPYIHNVGFQLVRITPGDLEIFNRMMEKYGKEQARKNMDLRRSNKW